MATPHERDLSIVVPVYNEEESLHSSLPELVSFCRDRGYRLILVNDGSSDRTKEILDELEPAEFLTVVHHKVNRGYGGAVKSGVRAAETRYVATVDADGQHVLDDVVRLHELLLAEDADMVVGNRDASKQSAYRRTGKSLIRLIAKLLMPVHIRDLNSGMKLYDTALARQYLPFCPDSMAFSDTIALTFIARKHLVIEAPITQKERLGGTSAVGHRTAITTVMEILNLVVLFHPMRVFLPLAVFVWTAGFLWNIPIFLRGEGVSVGAMLLMVSGLLFFLMGLITEMLATMRRDRINS